MTRQLTFFMSSTLKRKNLLKSKARVSPLLTDPSLGSLTFNIFELAIGLSSASTARRAKNCKVLEVLIFFIKKDLLSYYI